MLSRSQSAESVRPFLARFAVPRTAEPELPGYYSADRSLWVIETPQGIVPLATQASSQLQTLTKVHGEQTDCTTDFAQMVATHTRVRMEQDDNMNGFCVFAMATITEVASEKPDK